MPKLVRDPFGISTHHQPTLKTSPRSDHLLQISFITPQRTMSLSSMPTELQLLIISHLPVLESQVLRMTNRHFRSLILPATPPASELIEAQDTAFLKGRNLIYCGSCHHLRKASDPKMGLRAPDSRFCIPCGSKRFSVTEEEDFDVQEFLRKFRYQPGERWTEGGVEFVKEYCVWCRYCRAMLGSPDPVEEFEKYGRRICRKCLPHFQNGGKIEDIVSAWERLILSSRM